jgi:two-component system, OmpR family, phosphate regulon response regulator PhoB
MSALVLIIEDEEDLAHAVEYRLQMEGFQVRTALCGNDGLRAAREHPMPDLIILDLMLPDVSGTEVCRQLRAEKATRAVPILMLTAKGDEVDRVVGFEVGADDYLVKPCSMRELTLRIRAILRRVQPVDARDTGKTAFGRLTVDAGGHQVWVDADEIVLTALEFRLLTTFLERRGRVQSRDRLLDDVWGSDVVVTRRTVDTHVKRLREKLGPAGNYIETLRGVGYRFRSKPVELDE